MAKKSSPVLEQSLALLLPLGPVTSRAMFGGWGLYCEGVIFALIAFDRLYLRTDAEVKESFMKAGGEVFTYPMKGKSVSLPYCTPPKAALASSAKLLPWAEKALAAARRVKRAKSAKAMKGRRHDT